MAVMIRPTQRNLLRLIFLCALQGAFSPAGADEVGQSRAITQVQGKAAALLAQAKTRLPGLPELPVPDGNALTEARIDLGRKLFFDRRLSFNATLSCGMCHVPEQGFTQNELQTPVGAEGRFVKRNAPALYNVGYRARLFHDGRERSLENQVWQPLLRTNEMANPSIGYVVDTLRGAGDYRGLFEAAYGRGPAIDTIGMALASYQRALVSANSPFDRWYFLKQEDSVSDSVKRGFQLFQRSGCAQCHTVGTAYALFSDGEFHDTGIGYARAIAPERTPSVIRLAPGVEVQPTVTFSRPAVSDLGRYEATGQSGDRWKYRTPMLRNVALTAPYMHDGSLPDLEAVLQFYNQGGYRHPGLSPRLRPLGLGATEIEDLMSFLHSLTGDNIVQLLEDGRSTAIGDVGMEPPGSAR